MRKEKLGTAMPFRAAAIVLLASCALASPVRAQVAAPFVGKVQADTAYLTGAAGATDIAFSGDGRAVVTRKGGSVVVRRANGTTTTIAYPFGGTLDTSSEKGLLGVVADPNVAVSGRFYFFVSNGPTSDKNRVYAAVLTAGDTLTVDPTPIVAASRGLGPGLEGPANHNGGGLSIHGDQLYISVGDTGSNATPPVNKYGSCLNKGNGKVLRVNLDGTIPSDNPLVGLAGVSACATPTGAWATAAPDARVFAWGFRNPWRIWVDSQTGLLWTGDVGEGAQEEVSIGPGGQHYGFPFFEGAQAWGDLQGVNCVTMTPSHPCTPPAHSYGHSVGQAVTGGLIPDGQAWAQVFGGTHYLFADSSAGWLRALPVNAGRSGFTSSTALLFAEYVDSAPVSLRMGRDGAVYAVMFGAGAVYRFAPVTASQTVPALPKPATLTMLAVVLALAVMVMRTGAPKRRR